MTVFIVGLSSCTPGDSLAKALFALTVSLSKHHLSPIQIQTPTLPLKRGGARVSLAQNLSHWESAPPPFQGGGREGVNSLSSVKPTVMRTEFLSKWNAMYSTPLLSSFFRVTVTSPSASAHPKSPQFPHRVCHQITPADI